MASASRADSIADPALVCSMAGVPFRVPSLDVSPKKCRLIFEPLSRPTVTSNMAVAFGSAGLGSWISSLLGSAPGLSRLLSSSIYVNRWVLRSMVSDPCGLIKM